MPQYQAYATVKTTPSRKARKGDRLKTFLLNKNAARKLRKARKDAKEAALGSSGEVAGE